MSQVLNRAAKYTSEKEFEMIRDVLTGSIRDLDKTTLRKRERLLRRYADKSREKAIAEARKGQSGDLSKRKADVLRHALQRIEARLFDIEVKEAREEHKAAALAALALKQKSKGASKVPPGRTARSGMKSKTRKTAVPRLSAGRQKGHVLATGKRGQAKKDHRGG